MLSIIPKDARFSRRTLFKALGLGGAAAAMPQRARAAAQLEKEVRSGAATILEVTVAPDDLGKIIGRQGRVANALRVVARAFASVEGREVQVEIVT